jgi:hypothetical protein
MKAYRIESSVTINAPATVVWATLQDLSRRSEWDESIVASQPLNESTSEHGAQSRSVYKLFGQTFWIDMEYITWLPPFRSAMRTLATSPNSWIESIGQSWTCQSNADGSTTWTNRQSIKLRDGLASRLFASFFQSSLRDASERSQQSLKTMIESSPVIAARRLQYAA